jgi:hypothetical protein
MPTQTEPAETKIRANFASLAKKWLEESCELFPEQASKLGFHQYDSLLSRNTPENKVKAALDRMLKEEKVWSFSPQSGIYGTAGIPDRIAIVDGRFVGIECKADRTKKPTALQFLRMTEIEEAGGKCFVVYDHETIAAVQKWIQHVSSGTIQSFNSETQEP